MNKFEHKLENYTKAVNRLKESLAEAETSKSLTVRDGVIQRFEFTAELAWKTCREYLLTLEVTDINSPKTVMSEAYANGLISNEEGWLEILRDRNLASHVYDDEEAFRVFERIKTGHILLFGDLLEILNGKSNISR